MTPWPAAALMLAVAGLSIPALGQGEPAIPAQIVAAQYTTLSTELPAKIERISVKEGERFKAGQVLVSFDCAIQRAQLDEARAVVVAADKAARAHKRLLELNSTGTLEADRAAADAAVAQAKLNSAQAVTSKCAVAAPFSGRVVEQKARAHQYVQAGQPLLEILDDSVLEADFIVPSAWVVGLKPDMDMTIQVDETRKTYPAKIRRIGAKVDAVSHSIKVTAEIWGRFPDLIPGMSGRAQIRQP